MRTTSIARKNVLVNLNAAAEAARRDAERRAAADAAHAAAVETIKGILPLIEFDSKWTGRLDERVARLTALLGRGPDFQRGNYCPSGGGATTATWKLDEKVSLHLEGKRCDPYGVGGFKGNKPYFSVMGSAFEPVCS